MPNELIKHEHFVSGHKQDVKTLFVLESPCFYEIQSGYPCAGSTGRVMSKTLLSENDTCVKIPLGELIDKGEEKVFSFSLFDTFKFPMIANVCSNNPLTPDKEIWQELEIVQDQSWKECPNLRCHSAKISMKILELRMKNASVFDDYKNSLEEFINSCSRLNKIVVCGFIAQCMFTLAFDYPRWPWKKWGKWRNFNLLFVNHPIKYWDEKKQSVTTNEYGRLWGEGLDFE